MNIEPYKCVAGSNFLDYYFFSEGPKGRIKKIIQFKRIIGNNIPFYNLSFGDWDVKNSLMDDFVESKNKDTDRCLKCPFPEEFINKKS